MHHYNITSVGERQFLIKLLTLAPLTLIAIISSGCEKTETSVRSFTLTKCVLNAPPTGPFTEVDSDGDGATMRPLEIDVYRDDQSLGRWTSVATFYTVKNGRIARLVVTPLTEAVPMQRCIESIEQIADFLPRHESEKAKEWMQSIRAEEHKDAEVADKVSNRFILDDNAEIYVECVATGRKDEWYSVITFYVDEGGTYKKLQGLGTQPR